MEGLELEKSSVDKASMVIAEPSRVEVYLVVYLLMREGGVLDPLLVQKAVSIHPFLIHQLSNDHHETYHQLNISLCAFFFLNSLY